MSDTTPRVILGSRPGEIPSSQLETGVFNTGALATVALKANLPYIVVLNTDTGAHVITAAPRATADVATASPAPLIPAGGAFTFPTLPFSSLTDGTPNGTVFWFYSDVSPGPSLAAGSGTAATIKDANLGNYEPSSTGSFLMAGFGSTLRMATQRSGLVLVYFTGTGQVTTSATVQMKEGTGTPPVQNAAATGASIGAQVVIAPGVAGSTDFCVIAIVTSALGSLRWFDIAVNIVGVTDQLVGVHGGVTELVN